MNVQTVTFKDLSLINVTSPGELEIKYLKNNYDFDTLHLDDYKYKTQVPKIETFKNYTLVVMDFPYFRDQVANPKPSPSTSKTSQKHTNGILGSLPTLPSVPLSPFSTPVKNHRVSSSQVYFFIGKNYLVVLHEGYLGPVNDIFTECQKTLKNRNDYMGQGAVFLAYRIIDALTDNMFPIINELSVVIDKIDRDLEKYQSHDTLEDISLARRNLVVLHTILKPTLPLLSGLEGGKYTELNGSMTPFWGNVYDHALKIWDRLEDSRELLEGIAKSNESFLTSRTNEIIKVLTIFSATMLPLNLMASMYGMNIHLPFGDAPYAFEFIILLMAGISISMLLVFQFKRWF